MSPADGDAESSTPTAAAGSRCCPTTPDLDAEELAADVRILGAVGNETRYETLRLIANADDEGVCGCELQPTLGVSQGAVSQALSRLHTAGLVSRRKEGRWRYYSATERADRLLAALDDIREIENE